MASWPRSVAGRTSQRGFVGLALTAVAACLLLAGCTGKDQPETTTSAPPAAATAAPTAEEPPDPVQVNKDDAVAAYRNYVEAENAVGHNSFKGWEDMLLPLTSGEQADWVYDYYTQAADSGQRQVGADVVRSVTVDEYLEDPSGMMTERITLKACVDSTDVQSLDADGNNRLVPGTMGRFTTTVTMQHQTVFDEQGSVVEDPLGQAWWRVHDLSRDTGSPC